MTPLFLKEESESNCSCRCLCQADSVLSGVHRESVLFYTAPWFSLFSTVELYKEYREEAYTISLHPSGLFCLVGFSDKLQFISLLYEDMHVLKEFSVRQCREVRSDAKKLIWAAGRE